MTEKEIITDPRVSPQSKFSNTSTTTVKTSKFQIFLRICQCFYKRRQDTAEEATLLPPEKDLKKKTLVLDLDETLVHSSLQPLPEFDLKINVQLGEAFVDIFVLVRPGTCEFLQKVSEMYEVVIFTASLRAYADPVIDFIDKSQVVSSRLFRGDCVVLDGSYVKNLSSLGRDLKKVVIVDNSPVSYSFHPYNAVGISSWFDDKEDVELLEVFDVLRSLCEVEDVTKVLRNIGESKLQVSSRSIQIVNDPSFNARSILNSPKPGGESTKFTFQLN
jgi:RNA polymerase II subunit A small phosphatase-like protein